MTRAAQLILEAFRQAAIDGKRAPQNDELANLVYSARAVRPREALEELVSSGKIRIEIAGKNWRTVYLLGENLNTAPEPKGAPTWLVIDQAGKRRTK
jgi:hypothetical protein